MSASAPAPPPAGAPNAGTPNAGTPNAGTPDVLVPDGASFTLVRRVVDADLDTRTDPPHVNNVVYVRWVEEAATAHWEARTTPEVRAEVGWVLLRHEIDYRRPAGLGDAVVVRTTVGHLQGLTFERRTEVRRERDGAVLAESRTLWCPVDPRTGRPRRVHAELRALFSLGAPPGGTGPQA